MKNKFYLKVKDIFNLLFKQWYEIPVLVYHSIGERSRNVDSGYFPLDLFKLQIDFLKENNYNVITLHELLYLIEQRKKISSSIVSLTFDDGYEDNFSTLYPILKQYGFPATLFVSPNKIGQKGYLNFNQIRHMLVEHSIAIGSHTMNHTHLLNLDDRRLIYEIEDSKNFLEDKLRYKIDFFAYPWGAFSSHIQKIVKQSGYQAAFTTNYRTSKNSQQKDRYALPRLSMNNQDSFLRFLFKVSGFGNYFSKKIDNT